MNLFVFLGAPGSGKGTQAKRLSDTKSYHHLSTGDLLRKAIKENAPLGIKAKKFIDKGELVPDDVMINLVEYKQVAISGAVVVIAWGAVVGDERNFVP
jgi:adenylate kinase